MESKREIIPSLIAVLSFSFCLVLISEYVQLRDAARVFEFAREKFGVVIFCTVILFFFTMSMTYIAKSTRIGALISGVFTYGLSCVEFYKFSISGSHLVIEDLTFVFNIGEISGFAEVTPQAHIVRAAAALAIILIAMCFVKAPVPRITVRSVAGSVLCLAFIVAIVSPTSTLARGYEMFRFDTAPALTTMGMNERFDSDGFLGFLSQNATEFIDSDIEVPPGYSEKYMSGLAAQFGGENGENAPNIVIIASESFADLRTISDNEKLRAAYADFDSAAELGSLGTCELPTFGGYTVRSEFELLFGLPVMSMANVASPHSLLDEDEAQNTIVRTLAEAGYKTVYVHPFDGTFYNRMKMYPQYGFEKLVFDDGFDSSKDVFRRYIGDAAVFDRVKTELEDEESASFIFAMTMQNHQPYIEEGGSISDELDYYLEGVRETSKELYGFFSWLENFDEETVVLFVGDHFPFFTPQGGVYEMLGEGKGYTKELYEQKYLFYSNYSEMDALDETVSLFYIPHVLLEKIGVGQTRFGKTMLDEMEKTPVYGMASFNGVRNARLDAVTYDRTLGECYLG